MYYPDWRTGRYYGGSFRRACFWRRCCAGNFAGRLFSCYLRAVFGAYNRDFKWYCAIPPFNGVVNFIQASRCIIVVFPDALAPVCHTFGRVTLVGILICSVSIVVLEFVLWVWGFFKKEVITEQYAVLIAVMIGIADAFITFINMQQMMFFYRLYYADWFIALYMLVNGILYSSIGAWMGYRMGEKLKQVMGT